MPQEVEDMRQETGEQTRDRRHETPGRPGLIRVWPALSCSDMLSGLLWAIPGPLLGHSGPVWAALSFGPLWASVAGPWGMSQGGILGSDLWRYLCRIRGQEWSPLPGPENRPTPRTARGRNIAWPQFLARFPASKRNPESEPGIPEAGAREPQATVSQKYHIHTTPNTTKNTAGTMDHTQPEPARFGSNQFEA